MADGINVGDAVLSFFGDTTKLDASFEGVQVKADATSAAIAGGITKGFEQGTAAAEASVEGLNVEMEVAQSGAKQMGDVMNLAGQEAKFSMYEARGEVGLLGEEMGIRLPRHVRSFLVELPGVGEAMTAAFSATAVLFLVSALVEITKKASEFGAQLYFNLDILKESEKSYTDLAARLQDLAKQYEENKKKADDYGKSTITLAQAHRDELNKSVADLNKELKEEEADLTTLQAAISRHAITVLSAAGAYKEWRAGNISALEAIKGYIVGIDTAVLKHKQLDEAENKVLLTSAQLKEKHQEARVATNEVTTAQKELDKAYDEASKKLLQAQEETSKLNREMEKLGKVTVHDATTIELPAFAAELLKIHDAMNTVGVSTSDLQYELYVQTKAVDLLYDSYKKGLVTLREVEAAELAEVNTEIKLAQARGQDTSALDKRSAALQRTLGLNKQHEKDLTKITGLEKVFQTTLQQTGSISKATEETVAQGIGAAVAAYATGAASIEQALAKMAQAELASISERATVKAIEQLAAGFATLFTNPAESAGHFESAALYGTIGAATAVAGHALSGSSGSNGATGSYGNPAYTQESPTSATSAQAAPVTQVAVQRFGAGALVTGPTLALIGDGKASASQSATEAVLPLDDEATMSKLRDRMSSGPAIHVNVKGMISADNLKKVVKQMNKMVNAGQAHLESSNSRRLTRRSQ